MERFVVVNVIDEPVYLEFMDGHCHRLDAGKFFTFVGPFDNHRSFQPLIDEGSIQVYTTGLSYYQEFERPHKAVTWQKEGF